MAISRGGRRALPLVLPLAGLSGLVTGCTLDFDQFKTETQAADIGFITDAGTDMRGGPDLLPPPDLGGDSTVTLDAGADSDGDGTPDAVDNCPMVANPDQADADADGTGDACEDQGDGDTIPPDQDNCPEVANEDQADLDRDGTGDACDPDPDGDTLDQATETSRGTSPLSADTDGDSLGDEADNCPLVADRLALDKDADGTGDACDPDDDGDTVADWKDNCPQTSNADQADADGDGRGDACAGDLDADGAPDAMDTCPALPNPAQGATGCVGLFRALTFGRDVRDLAQGPSAAAVATAGGLASVAADATHIITTAHGLAENALSSVFVDAKGRSWATSASGVSVVRPDGFAFRMGPHDAGGGPQGTAGFRSVAVDANDIVYVSSDTGLNVLNNGAWTLLAPPALPSADVRGLYLSATGQVWAATAAGAVRLSNGAVDRTVTGIQGIGDDLLAVSGEADGSVWLLGRNGAAHLAADGAQPQQVFTGFEARGLTIGAHGDRSLATPDGLRRIDADGRLFPPNKALLPSADVRAVEGLPEQPRWVGTAEGLVEVDGTFATFAPDANNFNRPCVSAATRVGSNIWLGTDQGLFLYQPSGMHQRIAPEALPAQNVRVIRAIGGQVYVGTDGGVAILGEDGTAISQLTLNDGLPAAAISDIQAGVNGDIWFASDGNGIARRAADGTFTPFNAQNVPNGAFLSNNVKALAHDGGTLWIGTDAGVSVFNEGQPGAFAFPVTNLGGQLPDTRVQDIVVGAGSVYVATPQGVAVRKPDNMWTTLRRARNGWPNATGSDYARAVAFDGTALWIMLADSQPQPYGVLLRREGLDPIDMNGDGGDLVRSFTADSAGLPAAKGRSVSLEWTGQELFVSYCGTPDDVGGYSVLEGPRVVTRNVSAQLGLPTGNGAAALTIGPDGNPIYTAARAEGAPTALSLSPGPTASDPPAQAPFVVPPSVTGVLKKCTTAPGNSELWCAISGVGVGRRLDESMWVVLDGSRIRDLEGGDVRDIILDSPQSVWIATGGGVIRLNQGNPQLFNEVSGLPSVDVRSLAIGPDGKIYAGTAGGVGVYDPGTNRWSAITRTVDGLRNADVRAVAAGQDGALYFGTADGLFRLGPDGTYTDYHAHNGLPSNDVRALALGAGGRLVVGTASGLALGAAGGAGLTFTTAGFADGLPGRAVFEIVIAGDGRVWVRSDDGVAVLQN